MGATGAVVCARFRTLVAECRLAHRPPKSKCPSRGQRPVETDGGGEFFIYNVTRVIDCVDHTQSSLHRLDSGVVFGAELLAFDEAKIPLDSCCFRIPEHLTPTFFMLGIVADRVLALDLRGLAPREVWDTETGPRRRA
ncbi:MAG: hypothetical protein ABI658_23570 [Acidimicrobiales bacterium]